jgi:hypothetical protein
MASPFVEIEVGPRTVKVTNPDKMIFPDAGISKREMVEYYLSVGDGILRALRDRPVTLERRTRPLDRTRAHHAGLVEVERRRRERRRPAAPRAIAWGASSPSSVKKGASGRRQRQ